MTKTKVLQNNLSITISNTPTIQIEDNHLFNLL